MHAETAPRLRTRRLGRLRLEHGRLGYETGIPLHSCQEGHGGLRWGNFIPRYLTRADEGTEP